MTPGAPPTPPRQPVNIWVPLVVLWGVFSMALILVTKADAALGVTILIACALALITELAAIDLWLGIKDETRLTFEPLAIDRRWYPSWFPYLTIATGAILAWFVWH